MTDESKETCGYEMYDGRACGRKRYDGESCIFHSKEKKNELEFRMAFESECKKGKGDVYDFTGFEFPPSFFLFFKKTFDKKTFFDKACFWGDAKFNGSKFLKKASFINTTFKSNATFMNVKFRKDVTFNEAKFLKNSETGSNDKIKADFSGAIFEENADFSSAKFHIRTTFYDARFAEASFQNTMFSDKEKFNEIIFNEVIFNGRVSFLKAEFNAPGKIEMENTYFYDLNGLLEILDDNKKARGIGFFSELKEIYNFRKNAKTQLLSGKIKIILSTNCEAVYPIKSRQIKDDIYVMKFKKFHPIWYKIWWLFADCGRSFLRWALWSILFTVFFAAKFFSMGADAFFLDRLPFDFETMLYYSVVTFTTLGFGDITPIKIEAARLVMVEVIIGYIMLGGLISILANKLARRS
jgi:hypothetical protein